MAWAWASAHGPRLARDAVLGTLAVEGLREAAPHVLPPLQAAWEELVGQLPW
jgi:hypothetical protein